MKTANFLQHITFSSVACLALPYFSKLSHKQHDFRKTVFECQICFGFFYDCWLKYFQYWEDFREILSYISISLPVKYNYTRQILTKVEVSLQIFEKYSNTKFHENPSSRSRVVPCGQTDGHDETFIVAFRNFGTPLKILRLNW